MVAIGLPAPARRALIDDGLFSVSDLRKTSLAALKELHGMGPNAIRVLVAEMKKADLSLENRLSIFNGSKAQLNIVFNIFDIF